MRKIYFLLISCFAFNLNAQVNGDFVDWSTFGSYEDPDEWFSSNFFATGGDSLSCLKYTPAYSGNYSVKLRAAKVTLFGGSVVPGLLIQQIAYTSKPNSVRLAYLATDSASVNVSFHVGNTQDPDSMIGYANITLTKNSNWQRLEYPITWVGLQAPDSVIISMNTDAFVGSELLVDDLSLSMYSVALENDPVMQEEIYLNAQNEIVLNAQQAAVYDRLDLYNSGGQRVASYALGAINASLSDLASGVYFYSLVSSSLPENQLRGKLLKP